MPNRFTWEGDQVEIVKDKPIEKTLIQPTAQESQTEFIKRCMINATVQDEFPDEKQRLAVCFNLFKEAKK